MSGQIGLQRSLALSAVIASGATIYFFIFWTWFDFWRKHRVLTYTLMGSTFVIVGVVVTAARRTLLGARLDLPAWVHAVGWGLMGIATVFGFVADRQIGVRIRSFTPFFDTTRSRIRLRTTGAYGVVRHPIYATGRVFIFGIFLATGYPVALIGWVVFGLGAIWFTKQEERRLMELLEDPTEYERYRERVPALFPYIRPGRSIRLRERGQR